jgi:hypothetical protein
MLVLHGASQGQSGFFLKYSILSTVYDGNNRIDSIVQQPTVGLVSAIKNLEGEISVGYQMIKWDQGETETGSVALARVKYGGKIARVSLEGIHRTTIDIMGREYKDTGGWIVFVCFSLEAGWSSCARGGVVSRNSTNLP